METQMRTAENLKKVALIFFVLIGSVHILSGLMAAKGLGIPTTSVTHRILDIPFAMSALIYGISGIYLHVDESRHKIVSITLLLISILVFMILIYINFFIPDRPIATI